MKSSAWIVARILLLAAALLSAPEPVTTHAAATPSPKVASKKPRARAPGTKAPASGPATPLPDSALLARVNDRLIRVHDFRERYFGSDATFRPGTDSTGRVEFLKSLINKEVLGLAALAINPPLDFQDRLKLGKYRENVLINTLYQRMVVDSIPVSDQEIQGLYQQFSYELHLREMLFDDRATAERLRSNLAAGRTTWKAAYKKYGGGEGAGPDGDVGWVKRTALSGDYAVKVFALEAGGAPDVVQDFRGFHLIQAVERRPVEAPPLITVRRLIKNDLHTIKSTPRIERLFQELRNQAGVVYDTTNIRWAAARFAEDLASRPPTEGPVIDLSGRMPTFSSSDTSRVLARSRNGVFTLGQFITGYQAITPMLRHRVVSLEPFIFTLDGLYLSPQMLVLAQAHGIDKDPRAVAEMEEKREELLVDHVYQDSILSHVRVTEAQKKKYYDAHHREFLSIPQVRYAYIVRPNEAGADSVLARLHKGENAEALVHEDSTRGRTSSVIKEIGPKDRDPYTQTLFEELKPGQATKLGPDRDGKFLVLASIRYRPERVLSYDEVEEIVDESVRNIAAEKQLNSFLSRHRRGLKIVSHLDWVMRIELTDPTLD